MLPFRIAFMGDMTKRFWDPWCLWGLDPCLAHRPAVR